MNTVAPAETTPETLAETTSATPGQLARRLLKDLQAQFTVFRDCKPLAIGVDKELLARTPGLDRKVLRIALGIHTRSARYLKGIEKATARFDLDGKPSEDVTEAHRSHAAELLKERFRKEADQRKAQREAEKAEQAAQEAVRRHAEKLEQLAARFSRPGK